MTNLTIYRVEKVEMEETNHFERDDITEEFWTRDIIITDENGVETEIRLFSNGKNPKKNNLKVKNIK